MSREPDFSLRGFFYPALALLAAAVLWLLVGRRLPVLAKLLVVFVLFVAFRFGHRFTRRR